MRNQQHWAGLMVKIIGILLICSACAGESVPAPSEPILREPVPTAHSPKKGDQSMQVAAHRGYSSKYPENTMVAFKAAAKLDVDYIELDVQQTKDGVFVILHDGDLKRTAGNSSEVGDLRYSDIQTMDVGNWFSKAFENTKIPTLQDVLEFSFESGTKLLIELKQKTQEHAEEKLITLLKQYELSHQCLLLSNDYAVLEDIKKCDPQIQTVYLVENADIDLGQLSDADGISMPYHQVDGEFVEKAHDYGKKVHAWTVNSEQGMQLMAAMGIDVLLTDNPKLAIETLKKTK